MGSLSLVVFYYKLLLLVPLKDYSFSIGILVKLNCMSLIELDYRVTRLKEGLRVKLYGGL
jgi:hypothetical protein